MTSTIGSSTRAATSTVNTIKRAREQLVTAALQPKTFRYTDQLGNYLRQHFILHEPGRFLIIPKPYGISCLGRMMQGGGVFKDSVYKKQEEEEKVHEIPSSSQNDVILEECIPLLRKVFNEPQLSFNFGLKRYLSGAIILPAREEEAKHLKNSLKYVTDTLKTKNEYHYRCLTLLLGRPPENEGSITGYSTFCKVGNHKEYIFVPGIAKKRAKSGKYAVEGTVEYKVLETKYGCSLVEFGVNKFARHLPRLAFSYLFCPILGDPLYMQRLVTENGKPILINPGQRAKNLKQWFPTILEDRLGISSASLRNSMPLYCHVYHTVFPNYGWAVGRPVREQDLVDLIASAPPPPHFLAMVEALEMNGPLSKFLREDDGRKDVAVHGESHFA